MHETLSLPLLVLVPAALANSHFLIAEFRLLFPQLTGVLTLAFFIHNCVITIMKSNKNPENNVGLAAELALASVSKENASLRA